MDAIVYTSNTGFTAAYATLLGEETGLPVYALNKAGSLPNGAQVIYLGWLMAGGVQGLKQAEKRFQIRAVCGVGMGESGSQLDEVRTHNKLSSSLPLFVLQGGFDFTKLHGIYRFMMGFVARNAAKKTGGTPEEQAMLTLVRDGGSFVSRENLEPVLTWYATQS